MRNYAYCTHAEALAAPSGELTLAACETCGFAWNHTCAGLGVDATLLSLDGATV